MRSPCCAHVYAYAPFKFWTVGPIFAEYGMNIMP